MEAQSPKRRRTRLGSKVGDASVTGNTTPAHDDRTLSRERADLDADVADLEGENAKLDLLLEKMEVLTEEIVPEKLAKFKENVDEHQ